ncbi:MAG: hypothetical protein ACTSO7_11680 [Candidatus Heimdallarchaeota archaeon]
MKNKIRKMFRNKKAVSAVVSMVLILGATIMAVGIVYGVTSHYLSFDSKIEIAGSLAAEDSNGDGLIDFMSFPLLNKGLDNAGIESIIVHAGDDALLWYTLDTSVRLSEVEEINIYALSLTQQLQPLVSFYIEVIFEEGSFNTAGYTITLASELPDEILPIIESGGEDSGIAFNHLIERTSADDEYASRYFPTSVGYSSNLWFVLGAFEDDVRRPNLNADYVDKCGFGAEEAYEPYLLNDDQFTAGNIGTQSNFEVTPYNDSGDHPGLVAFDKYGRWDKNDDLNWGKRGIAYMWTYIYNPGTGIQVDVGANGASEYQVFVNGDHIITGNRHNRWYTAGSITLNPGLNLVMMKISAKVNAHFAGQVLFYDNAALSNLYSVWPTAADL